MNPIRAVAQFSEMLISCANGWTPRPSGHRCPECQGKLWSKVEQGGRYERFRCTACGWLRVVEAK